MALRAASNAGLYVPRETIDRCTEYVKRSQNPDGGFMYMIQGGGQSAFPRSAAGVVALYSAGIYDSPEIKKGLDYLMPFCPAATTSIARAIISTAITTPCRPCGTPGANTGPAGIRPFATHWSPGRARTAPGWIRSAPNTAPRMACIILQMPNNYLPIFQR